MKDTRTRIYGFPVIDVSDSLGTYVEIPFLSIIYDKKKHISVGITQVGVPLKGFQPIAKLDRTLRSLLRQSPKMDDDQIDFSTEMLKGFTLNRACHYVAHKSRRAAGNRLLHFTKSYDDVNHVWKILSNKDLMLKTSGDKIIFRRRIQLSNVRKEFAVVYYASDNNIYDTPLQILTRNEGKEFIISKNTYWKRYFQKIPL